MSDAGVNPQATIPRLIHQLWMSDDLPDYASATWRDGAGGWHWRLWTDADLLELVRRHYPDLEELYLGYPAGVQRADLGRYLVLDHCGGIYADIDTERIGDLERLAGETRIVLCEEPAEHFYHSLCLGVERLYFNGVMAGPKGHPFWRHLIEMVRHCRHAQQHVLESTGPLVLTGAVRSWPEPRQLALHSCHLFTPLTSAGQESKSEEHGPLAPARLVNHFWKGSWIPKPRKRWGQQLKLNLRKRRYERTRGDYLTREEMARRINRELLQGRVTDGETVSILIPIRDAEPWLDRCMELIAGLDYPLSQISVSFCEGDSKDGTLAKLAKLEERYRGVFRRFQVIYCHGGPDLERNKRWLPKQQRARRSHLAKVRNALIGQCLRDDDDWALWLDVDVCAYDPGILRRLLSERRKVVVPDCRLTPDGVSYDLNSFTDSDMVKGASYYKHVRQGLYLPPADIPERRHLHDLRFLDRVPLTSVGGTMILVDANVHRAGVNFPELPYDDLLETEGFGRLCRDFGVNPVGLPNVVILHSSD